MSAEQSWGADTVALGKRARDEASHPEKPLRRDSGPKLPRPTPRALAAGALALCALATAIVASGGESGSSEAPTREVGNPSARIVVKPPMRTARRESHRRPKPHAGKRAAGQLEGKREPRASAAPHELDAPEPPAEPSPETAPIVAPEPPAAVEFGM